MIIGTSLLRKPKMQKGLEWSEIYSTPQHGPSALDNFLWSNDSLQFMDHFNGVKYVINPNSNKRNFQNCMLLLQGNTKEFLFFRSYHRIKKKFYMEGLKIDVKFFYDGVFGLQMEHRMENQKLHNFTQYKCTQMKTLYFLNKSISNFVFVGRIKMKGTKILKYHSS